MYGKAYQAETILRKKNKRPFPKEVIKEVNSGEDLFTTLFARNIKEIKQKVKQENQTKKANKNTRKISKVPTCDVIREEDGHLDSADFVDSFDVFVKGSGCLAQVKKVDTRSIPKSHDEVDTRSIPKSHDEVDINEHKNTISLKEKSSSVVRDDKENIGVPFKTSMCNKVIAEELSTVKKSKNVLRLKNSKKGCRSPPATKKKFMPNWDDTFLNLIDDSVDLDVFEEEYKARRNERLRMSKKIESCKTIQEKADLKNVSEGQSFNKNSYLEEETLDSDCDQSPKERQWNKGKKSFAKLVNSTPARSAADKPLCLLSPILPVLSQCYVQHECNGEENVESVEKTYEDSDCEVLQMCFEGLSVNSEQNKNISNLQTPQCAIQDLDPIASVISADERNSPNFVELDENGRSSNSDENFSEKNKEMSPLQQYMLQSIDPFADSDIQENVQFSDTKRELLAKQDFNNTPPVLDRMCETPLIVIDAEENINCPVHNSVFGETKLLSNYCNEVFGDNSHIEENSINLGVSQNAFDENSAQPNSSVNSPCCGHVNNRKLPRSLCFDSKESESVSDTVVEHSSGVISDIRANTQFLNLSVNVGELVTSGNISKSEKNYSKIGCRSVLDHHQELSVISMNERRENFESVIKTPRKGASRRSHLVVPLTQMMFDNSQRISGFREVYIGSPAQRQLLDRKSTVCQLAGISSVLEEDSVSDDREKDVTFKDVVLVYCGQTEVLAFSEAFPDSDLAECKKIGEGVYGEVFSRHSFEGKSTVIKIMPIEGNCQINGEPQKTYEEILPEIVITLQLSKLRENETFGTPNFPELIGCWCVHGTYPSRLLDLWHEYDEEKTSENDSPEILPNDQIFIILELSNVGNALEGFTFNSAEQSLSAFMQVVHTLAVAEAALEFEHRDLHWGNILIQRTKDKTITCKLYGEEHIIHTLGIQASVIDFTLSRITFDGCCIYNNLAEDPALFEGQGDYQFDMYRMMRDQTENNWQVFQPYNNVLWLSYVLQKMITGVYYRNEKTKVHKKGMSKLKELSKKIFDFKSAIEVALSFSKEI